MKLRLLLLFVLLALQGCMHDGIETIANKDIDKSLKATIKAKNDSLLYAMAYSDNKAFKALGSPDFIKHLQAELGGALWAFRKGFVTTDYVVYDEYYNKHESTKKNSVIVSEDHKYTFTFLNEAKDTYVSMLITTSANKTEDYLITIIYSLIDGQWKIDSIEAGFWGLYGKNAHALFDMAKKSIDDKHAINAFNYADAAEQLLEPAGKLLVYDGIDKLRYYRKKWMALVNTKYRFPYRLTSVSTQPAITAITPVKNAAGICNMFIYASTIPLTNKAAIEREYDEVRKEVKKIYPDVDFDQKYTYYRVFNPGNAADFLSFADVKEK